jgi:Methyltransferase domain
MSNALKELDLNELPKMSAWPARLLGLTAFGEVKRDHAKIQEEYSDDKWQKCHDILKASNYKLSPHDLRMNYHEFTSGDLRPCLLNNKLHLACIADIMPLYDTLIDKLVRPSLEQTGQLVELGCGPGFIMDMLSRRFPKSRFMGGDFADSAIELAKKLYPDPKHISVQKLDFYADSFPVIEKAEGQVTVFTCQALEQIPDCSKTIKTLAKYRDKIKSVVHLEPCYDLYDDTLMGLMRKRYIEINDYNRNLVSTLRGTDDIEVMSCEPCVIGWNPFNALAATEWRFK